MTRELKLALIVGFALVLVVTVLISDHLSHARQTKLAVLPTEPAKVTEPPPIALENGASTLPQNMVTEPQANAPAPLIGSMPGTETDPLVIAQGTPTPRTAPAGGTLGSAAPTGAGTIDLINPHPQTTTPATGTQPGMTGNGGVQPIASNTGGLEDAVRNAGGEIRGNTIFVPGVQTTRETMAPVGNTQPLNGGSSGVTPLPSNTLPNRTANNTTTPPVITNPPVLVQATPASTDRLHTVASGENLFKIAGKYYSDGKVWRKLAKYNNIDANTPLKIGQKLKVPTMDVLVGKAVTSGAAPIVQTNFDSVRGVTPIPGGTNRAPVVEPRTAGNATNPVTTTPANAKTRPYTIKKGDSLAAIAQRELGTTKRAKDIIELNRKLIKNPDNVPLGVTIQLPAA